MKKSTHTTFVTDQKIKIIHEHSYILTFLYTIQELNIVEQRTKINHMLDVLSTKAPKRMYKWICAKNFQNFLVYLWHKEYATSLDEQWKERVNDDAREEENKSAKKNNNFQRKNLVAMCSFFSYFQVNWLATVAPWMPLL